MNAGASCHARRPVGDRSYALHVTVSPVIRTAIRLHHAERDGYIFVRQFRPVVGVAQVPQGVLVGFGKWGKNVFLPSANRLRDFNFFCFA